MFTDSRKLGFDEAPCSTKSTARPKGRCTTVYKPAELRRKRAERSSFVVRVLQ